MYPFCRNVLLVFLLAYLTGCEKSSSSSVKVPTAPVVSSDSVTTIHDNWAQGYGTIISDGGSEATDMGICWDANANPTIALTTKASIGTISSSSFGTTITGLTANTTYHMRAYVTNVVGTAYGRDVVFTTTGATGFAIGANYQGGIIAYLLQPGDPGYSSTVQHGLIAAPANLASGLLWWNGVDINTGASGTALGTGLANTNSIVSAQGSGSYAAKQCRNLTTGGYSDWYLPSKNELHKLYLSKDIVGGFYGQFYWTSTEYSTSLVDIEDFTDGSQAQAGKGSFINNTRAVRSF